MHPPTKFQGREEGQVSLEAHNIDSKLRVPAALKRRDITVVTNTIVNNSNKIFPIHIGRETWCQAGSCLKPKAPRKMKIV